MCNGSAVAKCFGPALAPGPSNESSGFRVSSNSLRQLITWVKVQGLRFKVYAVKGLGVLIFRFRVQPIYIVSKQINSE